MPRVNPEYFHDSNHLFKPGIRMMAGKIVIRVIWQCGCARGRFTLFHTVCVVSCMNTRVRRTLADFVLAFGPPNLEFEAKLTNLAGSLPPFRLWFTYHLHSIQWWSRFAFLSFHCYSFSFFRWAMCVCVCANANIRKSAKNQIERKKTGEKNKINKKTNKKHNQNTDKKESTNTNKRKKITTTIKPKLLIYTTHHKHIEMYETFVIIDRDNNDNSDSFNRFFMCHVMWWYLWRTNVFVCVCFVHLIAECWCSKAVRQHYKRPGPLKSIFGMLSLPLPPPLRCDDFIGFSFSVLHILYMLKSIVNWACVCF